MKHIVKQSVNLGYTLIAALCLVMLCTSCSDTNQHHDLKKYAKNIKNRQAKALLPLPAIIPPKRYAYPKTAMRNPFKPLATEAPTDGPDQKREKEPLEGFPLDSLRMVGLLQRDKTIWAVIQGPNGDVFRATVGNYLGQHHGKIVSIEKNEVQLEEMVKLDQKWEKRPATLALINDGDK